MPLADEQSANHRRRIRRLAPEMTEKAIAELMAAGEVRKAELIRMAGGLYMPSSVATILAISEQLVEERRKAGELIAVETGEGYRYPACQFMTASWRGSPRSWQ